MELKIKNKFSVITVFIVYFLFSQVYPFIHIHELPVNENVELELCFHYPGQADLHEQCEGYHDHDQHNFAKDNISVNSLIKKRKNSLTLSLIIQNLNFQIDNNENFIKFPQLICLYPPQYFNTYFNKAPPFLS